MPQQVRTFIAIELAHEVRTRTVKLMGQLGLHAPSMKWVEPENLHITLLFLGEVGMLDVPRVCRVVTAQASRIQPFELMIAGVGGFPNARRPKVLWAGIREGAEELKRLHDLLEDPLLELGCYRREGREYTPHLTLGRGKSEEDAESLAELLRASADWEGGRTRVEEVLVMGSELRRSGPVYSILGRAPCGMD